MFTLSNATFITNVHMFLPYRTQYIFALVQIIFDFVDQNQQHHILSLNLESYEQ